MDGKTLCGLAWATVVVLGIVVAIPRVQQKIGMKSAILMLALAWVAGSIIAIDALGWPRDWRMLIPIVILGCILVWVFVAIRPKLHGVSLNEAIALKDTISITVQKAMRDEL